MADWPQETTIAAFKREWILEGEAFWTTVFSMHQEKMQSKAPKLRLPICKRSLKPRSGWRIRKVFRQ